MKLSKFYAFLGRNDRVRIFDKGVGTVFEGLTKDIPDEYNHRKVFDFVEMADGSWTFYIRKAA